MIKKVEIMLKSLKVADQVIENLIMTIMSAELLEMKEFKIIVATDDFKVGKVNGEVVIVTENKECLKFGDELASVCRTAKGMVLPTIYAMTQTLELLKEDNKIKDFDILGNAKDFKETTSALVTISL